MDKLSIQILTYGIIITLISTAIFAFLIFKGSKITLFNKNLKKECAESNDINRYYENRKRHDWYYWSIVPLISLILGITFIVLTSIRLVNM